MNEKDKLTIMLEQTETRLRKEKQKTLLFMTIYSIIICGGIIHSQYNNIKDIIIESTILGVFISFLTLIVYFTFTSLFTSKESLENIIVDLKIKIDRTNRKDITDADNDILDNNENF